jgi:hypothetical protein
MHLQKHKEWARHYMELGQGESYLVKPEGMPTHIYELLSRSALPSLTI